MLTVHYWTQDYQYMLTKIGSCILHLLTAYYTSMYMRNKYMYMYCTLTHLPYHFVSHNYS